MFSNMKKVSLLLFLFFNSFLIFSQIKIDGTISNHRSEHTFPNLELALFDKDSVLINKLAISQNFKLIENFAISVDYPGKYIINIKGSYIGGIIDFHKEIKVLNDTNISISLEYPLHYQNNCRKIYYKKSRKYNLPLEDSDLNEYKRIQRLSKKLNLQKLNRKEFNLRLWEESAFEYGGGRLYEIIKTKDNIIQCKRLSYSSNYLEIIKEENYSKKYKNDDEIFNKYLSYKIEDTLSFAISENDYEQLIILLDKYNNCADYCTYMIAGDRHPAMDGYRYYFEVNTNDLYSFTSFENPDIVAKHYKQIMAFMEIKNFIISKNRN